MSRDRLGSSSDDPYEVDAVPRSLTADNTERPTVSEAFFLHSNPVFCRR